VGDIKVKLILMKRWRENMKCKDKVQRWAKVFAETSNTRKDYGFHSREY
jgi:hypothetical protein